MTTVVVTGLGATTPLGGNVRATWENMLAGRSGTRALEQDWARDLAVRIAAPAAVDPTEQLDRVEARRLDRSGQLVLVATREAWADAGTPTVEPERLGVVVASGIGGILTLLNAYDTLRDRGPRRVSPLTVPMLMPNRPAATVSLELGARAGVHAPVSACASGAEALAHALTMIRSGRADVVAAGGTEAAIHALTIAAFGNMLALSRRNDEPERASRPFDKGRDGFVLGEGAGIVVLESAEHAKRRGARVYCEFAGAGMTGDSHDIVQPDPDGVGPGRAMRFALEDAEMRPDEVAHINAHATSTPQGDIAEAVAVHLALGESARHAAVSSTKSMTGHLLGGTGAVESIATILAIHHRTVPPTVNLDDPDDEVDLDLVRGEPRRLDGDAVGALNNSFGFGGHNVTLAFHENR